MTNFILLSGGPGLYDSQDPEDHDLSWSNYVDCPLLLSKDTVLPVLPVEADEEVWWFVYKKAFENRWNTDILRTDEAGKDAVKKVRDQGFANYAALIESRAASRGWKFRWLSSADDFWTKLGTFTDKINKVYYWGHGKNDLWLTITHDPGDHTAREPAATEIITVASIAAHNDLKKKFSAGSASRQHCFEGCNTSEFAKQWNTTFTVHSQGVEGKIDFKPIFQTGGLPALVGTASRKKYP